MSTATTGEDLRLEREATPIKAYELAAEMGVHSTRVSQIEALASVTTRTAARYRAALQKLSPVAKTSVPQ